MGNSEGIKLNWYDHTKGWEQTKPGWHERIIFLSDCPYPITRTRFVEILRWMYEKLDNCERHCRWQYNGNYFNFKFRYERDLIFFSLRW